MRHGFNFLLSCIIFAGSTAFVPTACISKGVEKRTFAAPLPASNPFLFRGRSVSFSREKIIRKDATSVVEKASSESSAEGPSPIVAIINFFAINELVKILFAKYAITFPSPLAGCGALLAAFLILPSGSQLYDQFAPGAKVLAKWLPVFFVPSLILLPLAEGAGSPVEVSCCI